MRDKEEVLTVRARDGGCGFILRDLSLRLDQKRFQNRERDSYSNRPPSLARGTEIHLDY